MPVLSHHIRLQDFAPVSGCSCSCNESSLNRSVLRPQEGGSPLRFLLWTLHVIPILMLTIYKVASPLTILITHGTHKLSCPNTDNHPFPSLPLNSFAYPTSTDSCGSLFQPFIVHLKNDSFLRPLVTRPLAIVFRFTPNVPSPPYVIEIHGKLAILPVG